MIDLRHPLAVLATRMPWTQIETSLMPLLAHRDREGWAAADVDLFGPTVQLAVDPVTLPRFHVLHLMRQSTWPRSRRG